MDRLIEGHSAREFMTESAREFRQLSESPFAEAPRAYRFPPVSPLTTAGYSPDNGSVERSLRYTDQLEQFIKIGPIKGVFSVEKIHTWCFA